MKNIFIERLSLFLASVFLSRCVLNIVEGKGITDGSLLLIGIGLVAGMFVRSKMMIAAIAVAMVLVVKISLVVKEGVGSMTIPGPLKCIYDATYSFDSPGCRECLKCCYGLGDKKGAPSGAAGGPPPGPPKIPFDCNICPKSCASGNCK